MKRFLPVILILAIAFTILAQEDKQEDFSIPLSKIIDSNSEIDLSEMYVAFAAGIDKIEDGKCMIELENPPELYYVVLTALTPSGDLYYSQAEEDGFIVKEESDEYSAKNIVEFQYIVFAPISKVEIKEDDDDDDDIGISTILPVIQPNFPNSDLPVKRTDDR